MIIDLHTHIWPEAIAQKTVNKLEMAGNIRAFSDGTIRGLLSSMEEGNVDLSIVLPVVTRPRQFDSVNTFAAQLNAKEKGLHSFGGIHPENTKIREKLKQIQESGLLGIKLHPDYQNTFIDDPGYQEIIGIALELGLLVVVHAGIDIGLPGPVHCPPERIKRLYDCLQLDQNVDNLLILAHTGGYDQWQSVYEQLAGKKLYFDCSYSLGKIPDELFLQIVRKQGADRILFGSDSPWGGQKETLRYLRGLGLDKTSLQQIEGENAKRLLRI